MRASWLATLIAASIGLSPLGGCTCGETSAPPPPPERAPAVAAPKGLVATLVLPSPATSLEELREAMAGPMLLLPRSVGGLVVNLFGLPITAADLIDERLPILGATLVAGEGEAAVMHNAVAIHVKDGRRLAAHLSTGPDATFDAAAKGELTWLTPKPALRQARLKADLAIVDNYLLAGDGETALRELGLYLARGLARAEPPSADLGITWRGQSQTARLKARLERLRGAVGAVEMPSMIRALTDPESWLQRAIALLDLVGEGEVTVNLDPEAALVVDATVEAKDAAAKVFIASLPALRPRQVSTLPEGTVGALSWAEPLASRRGDAAATASQVRAALPSMTEGDEEALAEALAAAARGRGPETTVALRCTGVGLTGMAMGDVADEEALVEGVKGLMAVTERPSLVARLEAEKMEVSRSETRARHIPHDVYLLRLAKLAEGEEAEPPPPIDLRWVVAPDRYYAAAGMESLDVLQLLHAPDPERRWSHKPRLAAAIERLPSSAWLSLVVEPHGLNACLEGKPGGAFATPASLVVGPKDGGAVLRLELDARLLRVVGGELF